MMKPEDFFTKTEIEKCGRGAHLKRIDKRLKMATPLPPDQDEAVAQLIALLSAIHTWIAAKMIKHKGGASDNGKQRMKVIEELKQEVAAELTKLGASTDAISKSSLSFARHKVSAGKPSGLRGLGDGYAYERKQFTVAKKDRGLQKSEKLLSYSASYVNELGKQFTEKDLSKMSFEKFQDTWQAIQNADLSGSNESTVHFLRKNERLGFLAWVQGGKFYKNSKIEYATPNGQSDMYAMDKYGNLITKPSGVYFDLKSKQEKSQQQAAAIKAKPGAQLAQYNHSSLNAGADVICAGLIEFNKGIITYIDNASGHYKPTPKDLQNAVRSLHEADDADLKQLKIKVYVHDGKGGVQELDFNNYNVFLGTKF